MHDFQYKSKNSPEVKHAYQTLLTILHETQDIVRDKFTFSFRPVGSYSRNMITYNTKSNIGFDFDINIEVNDDDEHYTAQEIKNTIRNALHSVVKKYGYSFAEDSTRVLTIKFIDHEHSRILHSCDFAIVNNWVENGEHFQEYIHFNKRTKSYTWQMQSKGYPLLPEKINWLKGQGYWNDLRDYYLYKKNTNSDSNVRSRTLFAISVQELCQKYGYFK